MKPHISKGKWGWEVRIGLLRVFGNSLAGAWACYRSVNGCGWVTESAT